MLPVVDPRNNKPVPSGITATAGGELVPSHDDPRGINVSGIVLLEIPPAPGYSILAEVPSGLRKKPSFLPLYLPPFTPTILPAGSMALASTCPGSFNVVNVPLVSRRYACAVKFLSAYWPVICPASFRCAEA